MDISSQIAKMLKPIRELAANWDIDIACELEEYMTNLSHIDLSVDGVQINFAEAALLIQGSAAVYSKKVEYLYSILLRTLEHVSQQEAQRVAKKASSIREDGKDEDVYEEEPLEFLSLDDIVEENMADNIDLEEDWGDENMTTENGQSQNAASQQRAALRFAFTLGNTSSMSTQSTSMDVPSIDNPRINGSDFRMNSCFLSSSGALMLGSSMDLISQSFSASSRAISSATMMTEAFGNDREVALAVGGAWEGERVQNHSDGYVDHDDDDHAGAYAPVPYFAEPEEEIRKMPEASVSAVGVHSGLPEADKVVLQSLVDPWALHDPHAPGLVAPKPFAKGKPYKIPAAPKTRRSAAPAPVVPLLAGLALTELNYALAKPFLPEFAYIHAEEARKSAAARLQHRKAAVLAVAAQNGVVVDASQLRLAEEPEASHIALALRPDEEDEDEDLVLNFGAPPTLAAADLGPMTFTGNHDGYVDHGDDDRDDNDYTRHTNGRDQDLEPFGQPSDVHEQVEDWMTYEEHCKVRLEEYFRSAQQYVQGTDLSARLDDWSSKLTPLLLDQESRPSFDIQDYGNRLIDCLKPVDESFDPSKTVSKAFSEIFISKPSYEVSRSFSSMLQLANMGNIRIERQRNKEGLHDITLVLLSTEPAVDIDSLAAQSNHDSMDTDLSTNSSTSSKRKSSKKTSSSRKGR